MPLRSSRFIKLGYLHYYEHIRLPSITVVTPFSLEYPTFTRYLRFARNIILLRISLVGFTLSVSSIKIAGLISSGRLTDITLRNDDLLMQITNQRTVSLNMFVSAFAITVAST